ncbi:MAG: hypothetical protein R3C28_27300 [Pirellulaceae bacterium]
MAADVTPAFTMQFISKVVLAVGKAALNGFNGPAMVSLNDVSSLTEPSLIDQFTFERFLCRKRVLIIMRLGETRFAWNFGVAIS